MTRPRLVSGARLVVKVGSSSLLSEDGLLDAGVVTEVSRQVADVYRRGYPTVLVSSGAVAAGLPALGLSARPADLAELQVAAAVGQGELMARYARSFAAEGFVTGQVLLTKDVLANRNQYLNARRALDRMLTERIVPVVNENDTVVVDELKLGDNDRLAALVAHLVGAGLLLILTDTDGLFSDDPRTGNGELLQAVRHTDEILDRVARGVSGPLGSGGVATKVAAARMAAWSGIPTVIASSAEPDVVARAVTGEHVGTWVRPGTRRLAARKLWIAFGQPSEGKVTIDEGAVMALVRGGASLLPVGVVAVEGSFARGSAVEVVDTEGRTVAKGLTRLSASEIDRYRGRRTTADLPDEVVHRDDLVVLVG